MSVARADGLFPVRERGCQTRVEPAMEISDLGPELRYWIHRKLD